MVYVINAHDCHWSHSSANLARVRNQLFTAITRSKAWVRVLGVGSAMDKLAKEYAQVKKREYRLEFKYPDAETRKSLRILLRDVIPKRGRRKRSPPDINDLLDAIETGDVDLSDLSPRVRERLQKVLRGQR